jgi:hypothetical protein
MPTMEVFGAGVRQARVLRQMTAMAVMERMGGVARYAAILSAQA